MLKSCRNKLKNLNKGCIFTVKHHRNFCMSVKKETAVDIMSQRLTDWQQNKKQQDQLSTDRIISLL